MQLVPSPLKRIRTPPVASPPIRLRSVRADDAIVVNADGLVRLRIYPMYAANSLQGIYTVTLRAPGFEPKPRTWKGDSTYVLMRAVRWTGSLGLLRPQTPHPVGAKYHLDEDCEGLLAVVMPLSPTRAHALLAVHRMTNRTTGENHWVGFCAQRFYTERCSTPLEPALTCVNWLIQEGIWP